MIFRIYLQPLKNQQPNGRAQRSLPPLIGLPAVVWHRSYRHRRLLSQPRTANDSSPQTKQRVTSRGPPRSKEIIAFQHVKWLRASWYAYISCSCQGVPEHIVGTASQQENNPQYLHTDPKGHKNKGLWCWRSTRFTSRMSILDQPQLFHDSEDFPFADTFTWSWKRKPTYANIFAKRPVLPQIKNLPEKTPSAFESQQPALRSHVARGLAERAVFVRKYFRFPNGSGSKPTSGTFLGMRRPSQGAVYFKG